MKNREKLPYVLTIKKRVRFLLVVSMLLCIGNSSMGSMVKTQTPNSIKTDFKFPLPKPHQGNYFTGSVVKTETSISTNANFKVHLSKPRQQLEAELKQIYSALGFMTIVERLDPGQADLKNAITNAAIAYHQALGDKYSNTGFVNEMVQQIYLPGFFRLVEKSNEEALLRHMAEYVAIGEMLLNIANPLDYQPVTESAISINVRAFREIGLTRDKIIQTLLRYEAIYMQ